MKQGVVFVLIGMLMSRASLSITLILASSLVAACGGGGGGNSADSSADQGATMAASTADSGSSSSSCADGLAASGSATVPYDDLPYCDPAPLAEMMAMDDAAYQNQLSNHWPEVESLLHRYVPPNVIVFPAPRNFSGAQTSCLEQHGLLACREYMRLLIGLNESKQQ